MTLCQVKDLDGVHKENMVIFQLISMTWKYGKAADIRIFNGIMLYRTIKFLCIYCYDNLPSTTRII